MAVLFVKVQQLRAYFTQCGIVSKNRVFLQHAGWGSQSLLLLLSSPTTMLLYFFCCCSLKDSFTFALFRPPSLQRHTGTNWERCWSFNHIFLTSMITIKDIFSVHFQLKEKKNTPELRNDQLKNMKMLNLTTEDLPALPDERWLT